MAERQVTARKVGYAQPTRCALGIIHPVVTFQNMTKVQKNWLLLAAVALVAVLLFPKWTLTYDKVQFAQLPSTKGSDLKRYDKSQVVRSEPFQGKARRAFLFSGGPWDTFELDRFSRLESEKYGDEDRNHKQTVNLIAMATELFVVLIVGGALVGIAGLMAKRPTNSVSS